MAAYFVCRLSGRLPRKLSSVYSFRLLSSSTGENNDGAFDKEDVKSKPEQSNNIGNTKIDAVTADVSGPPATDTQASSDSSGISKTIAMFKRVEDNDPTHISAPLSKDTPQTFSHMLRNSQLMQIGDPNGRIVVGTIFEVIGDDLYVDYGGKFHCVCQRPKTKGSSYKCGSKVRIRLRDLELSSSFLGSSKEITLLESDATLLGLQKQVASVP